MAESRLTYDQFKANILQWKNSHREEYNRFARLMTNGDERQYLSICRAIFKQLPKVKTEWELCWDDDNKDDFNDIDLLFNEEAVPEQIVEAYQKQRDENKSSDKTDTRFWDKVKSFFSGKSERHGVILSAPLVLSWLYYGKSFEAMVSMVNKQAANPEADRMDRQSCSWVAKRIIQVSIKNGFRTQSDWDRYFSMNDAIEKGNIGEWALRFVTDETDTDNDNNVSATNLEKAKIDATTALRTAGRKKIQEQPLAEYLDSKNKDAVISCIRNFVTVNTSAVHQALPFYVLKELRLVAGMHTAKEYSIGLTLQFPDLLTLKSESAIRQAVGFLKTARHVIKDGKDQSAPLIESDENQELYQKLVQTITNITASNTTDISAK
ncbi:DUF6043 family protein [Bacteroides fluxus]|uniref:DUF6043 family protein n=1 Tax=Bacteroides fluxus TaxID=626930 RepID=UPI0023554477|nr:DUF6043 family protein [Bacteroides fluxus]